MPNGKKEQQIFEQLLIVDAGAKGKSIAKAPDGRVIFVENAVPGDIVDIRTQKRRKNYYEGTAIHFHSFSDKRTQPVCEHFGYCGGCKWQNMSYENQLFYKQKEVENNLKHLGKIELPEINCIIGSDKSYFYRNKMEFSFSDTRWLTPEEVKSEKEIENRNALGFHISGAWDKILDINKCHLQEDPSNNIREAIKKYALEHHLAFYSPRNQCGFLRSIMIRISSTKEIMVVIQFLKKMKKNEKLC